MSTQLSRIEAMVTELCKRTYFFGVTKPVKKVKPKKKVKRTY